MKTKIHDTYIDLREVISIGPLLHNKNWHQLGCTLRLFGGGDNAQWVPMTDGEIDPYQVDDSKNAFARATAQANYNDLVQKWQATD